MGTGPNIECFAKTQSTISTPIIQYRHNWIAGFEKGVENDRGVEAVGNNILARFTGYIYGKNNAICKCNPANTHFPVKKHIPNQTIHCEFGKPVYVAENKRGVYQAFLQI
jgi:hypothetical protein